MAGALDLKHYSSVMIDHLQTLGVLELTGISIVNHGMMHSNSYQTLREKISVKTKRHVITWKETKHSTQHQVSHQEKKVEYSHGVPLTIFSPHWYYTNARSQAPNSKPLH